MLNKTNISGRTLTLIIGIIVALFIAISTLIVSSSEQEAEGENSKEISTSSLNVYFDYAQSGVRKAAGVLKKLKSI